MQDAKPVSTPLASHFKLSVELSPQTEHEREYMSHVPYDSAIGSLMYGMVWYVPVLIFHMLLVLLVDIWAIQEMHISRR